MTTNRDNSELLLTAFRYVAGELSAEKATDFEATLSGDQCARDALADVVELSEAIAVEEFERNHPLQTEAAASSRRALLKWGTITALCAVAAACLILFKAADRPDVTVSNDVALQPAGETTTFPITDDIHDVLALWSELGKVSADTESEAYLADDPETGAPATDEIPGWMLTAVAGIAVESAPDMSDEMRELMDDPDPENL